MSCLTRPVCCSQCGRDFPFGCAEQAATAGRHGFSHCSRHVEAAKQVRSLCTIVVTPELIESTGLVPAGGKVIVSPDTVVVSVPDAVHGILMGMIEQGPHLASEPVINPAAEFYGRGKWNGD